jgi:hypothetical protein
MTARRVMERRKVPLTPLDVAVLEHIFKAEQRRIG